MGRAHLNPAKRRTISDLMEELETSEEGTNTPTQEYASERQVLVNEPNPVHGADLLGMVQGNRVPDSRHEEFMNRIYGNTPFSDDLGEGRIIGPGMHLLTIANSESDGALVSQNATFNDTYHPGEVPENSDDVAVQDNGPVRRRTPGQDFETIGTIETDRIHDNRDILVNQHALQEAVVGRESRNGEFLSEVNYKHNPEFWATVDPRAFDSMDFEAVFDEYEENGSIVAEGKVEDSEGKVPLEFREEYGDLRWFLDGEDAPSYDELEEKYSRSPAYWATKRGAEMVLATFNNTGTYRAAD